MMCPTSTNYDEIIETEVCNKLIRLSCAKMVNSKNERGGAKLHRNLLILHLLRRARNEQKRSPPTSPEGWNMQPQTSFIPTQVVVQNSSINLPSEENDENDDDDDDDDDDDVDIEDDSENRDQTLIDLSCSPEEDKSSSLVCGPIEFTVRDEDDVDYSSLRLEPLQLPFATDAIQSEELTTTVSIPKCSSQQILPEGLSPELPLISFSIPNSATTTTTSSSTTGSIQKIEDCQEEDEEQEEEEEREEVKIIQSEDEQSSSSGSEEEEEDYYCKESNHENLRRQHRKRKTSISRSTNSSSTPKKCCIEERQLTGLISVFNSGLSVVADQLLPRTSTNQLILQQTPDQFVPSLVRIACNPLICK